MLHANKWRSSPQLFKQSDWNQTNAAHCKWVRDAAEYLVARCPWNKDVAVPVVPAFQGTDNNAVWQICQTGFATVATLDDGWYGRGTVADLPTLHDITSMPT